MAMDIFATLTHQSLQLYSKLFPIPCLLCGLPANRQALCDDCINGLPRLGPACRRCASPLDSAEVCGRCLQRPPVQDRSFSLLRYQQSARRCITAFKYQQQIQLSRLFTQMMAAELSQRDDLPQSLIPIPLHARRIRQRGYNQSAELSRSLSNILGIAHQPDLLSRVRNTKPQSMLSFQQRRSNMRQAFQCRAHAVPAHIAIIDDVMTSGHTCSEAAKVLKAQGAEIIEVWTIARAISHY
jgi:ComF family protein